MFKQVCPHAESCALYGRFTMRSSLRIWQIHFCEDDFRRCERFQRAARGERVPDTLLPNGDTLNGARRAG
jgi:hypothetical protein